MTLRFLVVAILSCVLAHRAGAYSLTGSRWRTSSVTMHLQLGAATTALSDGFTSWGASAEDALTQWNTAITATKFNVVRDSTVTRAEGNRINNVFFSGDVYGEAWGSGVLAVTLTYISGNSTTETDVLFNNRLSWNSYRGALRSSATGSIIHDFHRVALHEFGHALGLDHPDENGQRVTALMNSRVSSLDALTADDIGGAQFLYGAAATTPTVAPPVITSAPTSRTVTVGQTTSFSVGASSSVAVTYQWLKGGAPLTHATAATLTFASVTSGDAGNYAVAVTNSAGSVTSASATLTVVAATVPVGSITVAPAIVTQPASQSVNAGGNVTFSVTASGSGPLGYQWRKDSTALTGATTAAHTVVNARAADAGTYAVLVTNTAGSILSTSATLTVNEPIATTPAIVTAPIAQTVSAGGRVSLSVVASSTVDLSYQWFKDGAEIPGATNATFVLEAASPVDGGSYTVRVTNSAGSVTTAGAILTVKFSRLVNLSTRGFIPAGGELTPGFYVRGESAKPLIIRAVGPTLSVFGIGTALAEAKLDVVAQGSSIIVASNNDWGGTSALGNAFASVGAFPLAADSKDAAVQTSLAAGGYTVRVTAGDNTTSGVTLAEIYDADTIRSSTAQLVNVSTLGFVGSGDNVLTAGFVISGNTAKRLLIRAVGPGLAPFGVTDLLVDPQLGLAAPGSAEPIATNDDWPDLATVRAAFTSTGAFPLTTGSKDAVLVVSLEPGAYTVIVSGVSGTASGRALVEIYDLDP